ncbi:MAG: hypothetical protein VW576_00945 [Opitutae bacterium]
MEIYVNFKFAIGFNKFVLITTFLFSIFLPNRFRIITIFSLIITLWKFYSIGDLNGGHGSLEQYIWRFYFSVIPVILIPIGIAFAKKVLNLETSELKRCIAISFLFLLMPIFLAFGTHAPLTFNMNFYACFFLFGILFFLIKTCSNISNNISLFLLALLLSIGPSFASINGRFNKNFYSLNSLSSSPLNECVNEIDLENSRIYVSNNLKNVLIKLKLIFSEINLSNTKYCLNFDAPGWTFLLGLPPHPIQPWTLFSKGNFTLKNLDSDSFHRSTIILRKGGKSLIQIQNIYPEFENSHRLHGEVEVTYDDIIHHSIQVYAPRNESKSN